MASFEDYLPDTARNNWIVQRALTEIDTRVLCTAMLGLSDELRGVIYRNVSDRVQQMCRGDIEARAETGQEKIDGAQALLLRLLEQTSAGAPSSVSETTPSPLPDVRLDTPDAVATTFRDLAVFAQSQGALALGKLEEKIGDPLMLKGICLLVDGWEPLLRRSMLEKRKAALLHDLEVRYDMILDGIDALCHGDTPAGIEEKLRSHIAHS